MVWCLPCDQVLLSSNQAGGQTGCNLPTLQVWMCLSGGTLKAVVPFCLVSMPRKVKHLLCFCAGTLSLKITQCM